MEVIPLVKWNIVALPKELRGWDLRNMHVFNLALTIKCLWRFVNNEGLWGRFTKAKYLKGKTMDEWLRLARRHYPKASLVWKALIKAYHMILKWVSWQVGNGGKVRIGEDPWILGVKGNYRFYEVLLENLHDKGIHYLREATIGRDKSN